MWYSATPEFYQFAVEYIGRKIDSNFVDVFACGVKPKKCQGRDPVSFEVREYANCYSHVFMRPSEDTGYLSCVNYHELTLQVYNCKVIRMFPPRIGYEELIENETFHELHYGGFTLLRSPTVVDLKVYADLLDSCTIPTFEPFPWRDEMLDIPMIWSPPHVRPQSRRNGCAWEELFPVEKDEHLTESKLVEECLHLDDAWLPYAREELARTPDTVGNPCWKECSCKVKKLEWRKKKLRDMARKMGIVDLDVKIDRMRGQLKKQEQISAQTNGAADDCFDMI